MNVETAASSTSETLDNNGSNNARLNVKAAFPSGHALVEGAHKVSSESTQIDSNQINKFTSQESQECSSKDSENISQFTDQSQSILRNANGSVINQSNNGDGVVVLDEG